MKRAIYKQPEHLKPSAKAAKGGYVVPWSFVFGVDGSAYLKPGFGSFHETPGGTASIYARVNDGKALVRKEEFLAEINEHYDGENVPACEDTTGLIPVYFE